MLPYSLRFLPEALAEWDALDGSVRQQFAKVLLKLLMNPRIPSAALSGLADCYKIKLRSLGFRLVYRVNDKELILLAIAVGKRDKSAAYEAASKRVAARLSKAKP
jgi:mRNA interferase RelE/StbE